MENELWEMGFLPVVEAGVEVESTVVQGKT